MENIFGEQKAKVPRVSIVVPIYNEEKYLAQCLQSLKKQDYSGEYEVIVVDNGSSDASPQIARDFGVKVISCPQRGVVYAREAGFKTSSGEIVVQADGDTIYPPDWLTRISGHFSAHPEAVAVAGDVVYMAAPAWAKPLQAFRRLVNSLSFRFLGKTPLCLAATLSFRRQALLKAGGYNTMLPFVGDEHDLLVRLSKTGKIVYDRHLLAATSSRRFTGRLWQFLVVDMFYGSILEQAWLKITGRSLNHIRACPRTEDRKQPIYRLRRTWAIVIAVIILGTLSYGYFYPAANMFGKTCARAASTEKVIALTFDDGPNDPYTSQILDILERYGVKATFFIVGTNAVYYPETIKHIVAEGHVLGNHSQTHRALSEFDIPVYSELDKAQDVIFEIAGVKPSLFRPPYGRKTPWELAYARKQGLVVVTWSISANDPHSPAPSAIEKRIQEGAHDGGIILLHDGDGIKHGSDRSKTVAALPYIIESLQREGYIFVTVPELLNVSPYIE